MAELMDAAHATRATVLDRRTHCPNLAVEKVHVMAQNLEPAAAVHPRPPFAERSHQPVGMTIVKLARRRSQRCRRERMAPS